MKEIFLSYHHNDGKIAAEVKTELQKAGFASFLAHDDEVSKIWRQEILKQPVKPWPRCRTPRRGAGDI
jgi:hypothetical protein